MKVDFLLVDDHPMMRGGIARVLLEHWPDAILQEAASLLEALALVSARLPSLVLLDLTLPDSSGLEGLVTMRKRLPQTPVLVLTMHDESAYAVRSMQAGADGFLSKDQAGEELIAAVSELLAGGQYLPAGLGGRQPGRRQLTREAAHTSLSRQEYRVMLILASGKSVSEAADMMGLSVKTVSTYRSRILQKLDIDNNAEMTRYCLQHNLLKTVL